ncbi:hypothetical protein [Paraburkholderia bryophila]|uniref:Uncharacterized protein n=1 Tax=Paraburkholderia bryophila TaxID=420952 RepID=A0A7Y9WGL3_9BURK|nr:hypothetical protein [Paraburkholderia bryophila]NYH19816.1 hypothetical protein [Paraburkholderia bryophila]
MAAASTDSAMHVRRASTTGLACALLAGGAATLVVLAGFGQPTSALWLSALTLATMIGVPLLMARPAGTHTTLATAATLIVTMTAMSAVPPYLRGLAHGTLVATLMLMVGAGACVYRLRLAAVGADAEPHHGDAGSVTNAYRTNASTSRIASLNTDGAVKTGRQTTARLASLALFAGLSSGSLARFQLSALCGASGAQSFWQIALTLTAVCALAYLADRSRGNATLTALYLARAALVGTLVLTDSPALAPLAARIFLVLDCLTIPALLNLRGNASNAANASSAPAILSTTCPGIAHHVGMVVGAALSTTSYFFGDGFVVLYAFSAVANVICAASLVSHQRDRSTRHRHSTAYHPTTPSA